MNETDLPPLTRATSKGFHNSCFTSARLSPAFLEELDQQCVSITTIKSSPYPFRDEKFYC